MSFHKLFSPNLRPSRSLSSNMLSSSHVRLVLGLLALLSLGATPTLAIQLTAHLSQHGVKGAMHFVQEPGSDIVSISANLSVMEEYIGEYSWGIYEYPVDYSSEDFCNSKLLGRRPIVKLDETLGKLNLPAEEGIAFTSEDIALTGPSSIWGRSLVLEGPSKAKICGSIFPEGEDTPQRIAEARFTTPIAGSVWFSSISRGDSVETKIFSSLYHVQGGQSSAHEWKIYISDILEADSDLQGSSCDFLQTVYDPKNVGGQSCSKDDPDQCEEGNLSGKFGNLKVGKRESIFTKNYLTDLNLEMPELSGPRTLFLVVFNKDHPESYFACSKIREIKTKNAKAIFSHEGIFGEIGFSQRSPFHPVKTNINFKGLNESAGSFHIHEFPVPQKRNEEDNPCSRTAGHFNPFNIDKSVSPPVGTGTYDKYEIGDLSGKYGSLKGRDYVRGFFVDPYLSLFGKYSVVGRSVVIHETPIPKRLVCANIESDRPMVTAIAQFSYPIVGRIIFRQDSEDLLADTTVFVESLLYSDGTKNDTFDHKWHVHVNVPGKDYFNWTSRCVSAGPHYNPYSVSKDDSDYNTCFNDHNPYICELGDLANKLGKLTVAGKKVNIKSTTKFFTDTNLPLSGGSSIIGHSIVVHDDHAPKHRGNRMACTAIRRKYRHKAVATRWFGNGITPPPVSGRLEFIQDMSNSMTHVLVDLQGMKGEANAYHVHKIPVQDQLEFPCTGDAVGGHYNPFNVDASASPSPTLGTPDQYEIGDLSGKYGLLAEKSSVREIHNDSSLPLFGPVSIVGRSIVVHKAYKAERWACASIGWGFDPDEAREVKAIASFHHPNGFAWGYIRFSQVVYRDGSSTDTTMEVRLKYPGKTNKDLTTGHLWSVYVNPVGHDASVKFFNARCTAAGYRWNPQHIQLADPNDHDFYAQECGPDQPYRCQVGDLSGRHGPLTVGGKAYVVNDVNLPLFGDWFMSAIGKSIVIHTPNGGTDRMACANIEEEKDIVKYATIRTKARFNLATFMEEVQAVMGVPEWFLYVDSRKTKTLFGGKCIQIQLHFTGPHANKLEQDFNRLIKTGKLDSPSIQIPGYVPDASRKTKLGYRECDDDTRKKKTSNIINDINDLYSSLTGNANKSATSGALTVLCSVITLAIVNIFVR